MKNAIVFLLLLGNAVGAGAQISVLPAPIPNSAPLPYKCTITNSSWTEDDLITWIFPDGQYMKREIHLTNNTVENNSVVWTPCAAYNSGAITGPDNIQAFIAKKGGTGNPPQFTAPFDANYSTTDHPEPFDFTTSDRWEINKSWNLSPNNDTYLFVSYRPNLSSGCPASSTPDFIELTFNTNQLELGDVDKQDYYRYENEGVSQTLTTNGILKTVRITNFCYNQLHKHIFFKVKTLVGEENIIDIAANGKFCGDSHSVVLHYRVEASPHDPNKKTVDIGTIYSDQKGPIKLTYTVQFHNDGDAPVGTVVVDDDLPEGLDLSTFTLVDAPNMNGLTSVYQSPPFGRNIKLTFTGSPGLPGLNQIGPSYSYDKTIYRYKFSVYTDPHFSLPIKNKAKITFYDGGTGLPPVITSDAQVIYVNQPQPTENNCCSSWQKFWQRFFNIFRREKIDPCKKNR